MTSSVRARPAASKPDRSHIRASRLALFLASQAVLGVLMFQSPTIATLAAAMTVLLTVVACLSKRLDHAVLMIVYGSTADVLWRMTDARVPWEGGKYIAVIGSVVVIGRFVGRPKRIGAPVAFALLLIPGAAVTLATLSLGEARAAIVGNLGGPLAIAAMIALFRQVRATRDDAERVLLAFLAPIVSVCAVASFSTLTAENLEFRLESNFATSGGFGPNQVSGLLGLGSLVVVLLIMRKAPVRNLIVLVAVGFWMVAQAFLTFSRGGLYSFVIALAAVGIAASFSRGNRSRASGAILAMVLGGVIVFSMVNSFTEGSLAERYQDTSTSNRADLAAGDFDLWAQSPVLGIGPGNSNETRQEIGAAKGEAHTEFTRLLAEHGMFGLCAILVLLSMFASALRHAARGFNRLIAVGLVVWTIVDMSHAATRIGAVAVAVGVANMVIVERASARPEARIVEHQRRRQRPAPSDPGAPTEMRSGRV